MSISLRELTIKNFRSFAGEHRISFPKTGMCLIDGKNKDTGGSSGAGKSCIIQAISYLCGVGDIPSTALQSWHTKDPMSVSGIFEIEGKVVKLTRSKNSSITVGGTETSGSNRKVTEKWNQIVGMDPDILGSLTVRAQKSNGVFLGRGDSDKKEFLVKVLGLEKYEQQARESAAKAKALESELQVAQGRLQVYLEAPEEEEPQIDPETSQESLGKIVTEQDALCQKEMAIQAEILNFDQELAHYREEERGLVEQREAKQAEALASLSVQLEDEPVVPKELSDNLSKHHEVLGSVRDLISKLEADDAARKKKYEAEKNWHIKKIDSLVRSLSKQSEVEERIEAKQSDLEIAKNSRCYTCNHVLIDDQAQQAVLHLQEEIKEAELELESFDKTRKTLNKIKASYSSMGVFSADPEIEVQKTNESKLLEGIADLESQRDLVYEEFKRQQASAKEEFLQKSKGVVEEVGAEFEARLSSVQESIKTALSGKEAKERELAEVLGLLNKADSSIKVLKAKRQAHMDAVAGWEKRSEERRANIRRETERVNDIERQLNLECDFSDMVGRKGYLGVIFDEILTEISTESMRIIEKLPNVGSVGFSLSSVKKNKNGQEKNQIVPVITVNGQESDLKHGTSGGMESAVELAVDLGVARVISARSGKTPGWLCLDESFSGFDSETMSACLEVLASYAEQRLVLVIEHHSEAKEWFSKVIEVEYENGFSRIVQD